MRAKAWGVVVSASAWLMACGSDYTSAPSPSLDADAEAGAVTEADGGVVDARDASVTPPEGCDEDAEPKDAAKCVVNAYGVFVDGANGDDKNAGTKESPVKTLTAAVALSKSGQKPRVYVCGGTYPENVQLAGSVSVYGGFGCGSWSYTGEKAKVSPASGYALDVKDGEGVVVSDVEAVAADGTASAVSSVAVRVVKSQVKFVRAKLAAGAGFAGTKGADGGTATLVEPATLNGNPANGDTAGAMKLCKYSVAGTSSLGGSGGALSGAGSAGGPTIPGTPLNDGAGGVGGTGDCNQGGYGHSGAPGHAGAGGAAATKSAELVTDTLMSMSGSDGTAGGAGQGGGGGGSAESSGGGGGGGCGGAPGLGGGKGQGGGVSVALLSVESTVELLTSELVSGTGGTGGTGGGGGAGGNGGISGCQGGKGGKGGAGGSGSGGAGGVSAGVVYTGTAPVLKDTTATPGAGGKGGAGGTGNVSGAGPDGKSGTVLDATKL